MCEIYDGENDWKVLELAPKADAEVTVATASLKHVCWRRARRAWPRRSRRESPALSPLRILMRIRTRDAPRCCVLTWQPAGAYTLQADLQTELGMLTKGMLVAGEYTTTRSGARSAGSGTFPSPENCNHSASGACASTHWCHPGPHLSLNRTYTYVCSFILWVQLRYCY